MKKVWTEVKREVGDDTEILNLMRKEHREKDSENFRRFSVITQPVFSTKSSLSS